MFPVIFPSGSLIQTGVAFLRLTDLRFEVCVTALLMANCVFAARADELADSTSEIDPQAIFDYLYFHVIPSPRTIFKGIFRLPPGHCAVFENGSLSVSPYWVPEFSELEKPSFVDLRTEFRQLLRNAVARQLDGGKPGCFLSGGTDSSTVAGMIGEVSGQQAATYSIGFEAEGYDEMEYARIAARHFKTEHHEYYVTPDDLVRSIPSVAQYYDQPFGNSSALPAYYCAKMAREDGVSKILAGDGGDELFGGNTRYAKQKVFGYYDSVPASFSKCFAGTAAAQDAAGKVASGAKGSQLHRAGEGCRCRIAARFTTCFIDWASTRFSTRISLPEWISMIQSGNSERFGTGRLPSRRRIANLLSIGVIPWPNVIFRKW